MLMNSRLLVLVSDIIAEVISFCQFIRVLITNGPDCWKVQCELPRSVFLLLRANQRKLCTSSENDGRKSRSA